MSSVNAFIGIGSNLDDPVRHVETAIDDLNTIAETRLVATSSLYRTAPMGPQDQSDYINAVAEVTTELPPLDLLDALQAIENRHGRVRHGDRWGPRTLDLDLLLFANKSIDLPRLKVPHYGLKQRNFVLIPLFEIAEQLILPDGATLAQCVESIDESGIEKIT